MYRRITSTVPAPTAVRTSAWLVALEENGVPKFSSNPVAHETYEAASTEAQRLAKLHPGQSFGIYSRPHSAFKQMVFTAPKPRKVFTGKELQDGTAPEGRYKTTGIGRSATFIVMKNGSATVVLFLDSHGTLEPMHPQHWNTNSFELVNPNVAMVVR